MDITVYLPDALGERAKEQNINLSRTLRDAIEEELNMRDAMKTTLEDVEVYVVDLEGEEPQGRITGKLIAEDEGPTQIYLTDDGRVLAYDGAHGRVECLHHPRENLGVDLGEALRGWLDGDAYREAMRALGLKLEPIDL